MPIVTAADPALLLAIHVLASLASYVILAIAFGGWLSLAYRRTSGSTLRAPIVWAAIALAAVLLVEWCGARSTSPSLGAWRYLAAVGTFCPSMALLGAKRPQDRGWQFVVATLWLVLALPGLQGMVFTPNSPLDLHPAWRWFLMLLIAIAVSNYLPTRYAVPALLSGAGQFLLLHKQTLIPWHGTEGGAVVTGCGLIFAAMTWVGCAGPRSNRLTNPADRVWRDFRDAFGAVWALRVMERINQAAAQAGRDQRLNWSGFEEEWDPLNESTAREPDPLQVTIRMLLRRFVSPEWIDRRRSGDAAWHR